MTTKNRSRRARQRRNRRILMTVCLLALVMVVSVGATIAWLTDTTDPVTNTFTVGDINITLDESDDLDLKMVPGNTIDKDPKVTVEANSEDCWLFVKVEESQNLASFISYTVDSGWTQLKDSTNNDVEGVYYRGVSTDTADQEFSVLTNDKVTVKDTVTKQMMNALPTAGTDGMPTLTFTAYACQKDGFADPYNAWLEASATPAGSDE